MAIDQKDLSQLVKPPVKESESLLQRVNIRTMKKDLQKLREFDATSERQKIVKKNTVKAQNKPQDIESKALNQIEKDVQELENRGKILQQSTKQEEGAILQAKKYANESEKQQIFVLEAQKAELQKNIQAIVKEQEPPLLLEKNKILIEQKNLQQKLAPLAEQEAKIEAQQKVIEDKEAKTNVASEKQALEKERWQLDDQRKGIEKQRWTIEGEISKLQEKIKNVDGNYKKSDSQEAELKAKIADIDNSLREIYHTISQREIEKRNKPPEQKKPLGHSSKHETNSPILKPKIQEKMPAQPAPQIKEKPYLKEATEKLKEKLEETREIEERRRATFMEDIEKWAALNQKKE